MIKARGTDSRGRPLLVLGLSHGNLDRLRAGQPIEFDGSLYGYPGTVLIFSGKDEIVMSEALRVRDPDVETILEKGKQP